MTIVSGGAGSDVVTLASIFSGGPKAAVTIGNTIYIDPRYYNPYTPEGQALIAHELLHVQQWKDNGWVFAWEYLSDAKYEIEASDLQNRVREALGGR